MSVESFKILPAWGSIEGEFGYGSLSAPPTLLSELRSRLSICGLFFRSRGAGRWANNISIECRYIHAIKDVDREWINPLYIKPKDVPAYDSLVTTVAPIHPTTYGGSQDLRTVISNTTITNPLYDPVNNPAVPQTLTVKTARYTDDLKVIVKLPIPKTTIVSDIAVTLKMFETTSNLDFLIIKQTDGTHHLFQNTNDIGRIISGKLFRHTNTVCLIEFPDSITNVTISSKTEYTEEYIVRRIVDKRWSDSSRAATSVPKRDDRIDVVTTSISTEIDDLRNMINTKSHLVTMPIRQFKRNTSVDEVVNDVKYYDMSFSYSDNLSKSSSYFNHDFYLAGRDDHTIDYMDFCITGKEEPVSYTGRANGRLSNQRSVDYTYLRTFNETKLSGGDGFDDPNMFKTRTEENVSFDKNGKYALIVEMCHLNWVEKYNGAPQELGAIYQAKDSKANESFDMFKKILLKPYTKWNEDHNMWSSIPVTDYQYLWNMIFESNNYPVIDKMKDDILKFFWTFMFMSQYNKKAWVQSSAPDCVKFPECTACMAPPDIIKKPGPA